MDPQNQVEILPSEKNLPDEIQVHNEDKERADADAGHGDWKNVMNDAIAGEVEERNMTVRQAFKLYPKSIWWAFAISLTLIMEGFDTSLDGVTGLPLFRKAYGIPYGDGDYQLEPVWQSAIGYASTISSFIGIFIASWFQDLYGYRRCLQISLVLFSGFHFVIFYAPTIQIFFLGKFLVGLPWGAFSSSAVSYSAEVTPAPLRGYLTTYNNLCWVIGQFLASLILRGTSTINNHFQYRIPYAVQWIWPVPLFILAQLAPESPWWLVKRGRLEEAKKAIRQLQSKKADIDPEPTVALMVRTNQIELEHREGVSFLDCFRGSNLRRTEIACMAWATQVLCGAWFGGGSTYFFQQLGIDTIDSFSLGCGNSAIGIFGTLLSWVTITFVGRRKVFLGGLTVLCTLLLLIGILEIPARKGNMNVAWGQAVITFLWTFTYDFTIGPLAFCIAGEISSSRLRGKTVGLARNHYNIWGVVAGVIQPYMLNPLAWDWRGYSGFFWGATCFLCLVWAYFRLPECKGRTYRELDILFEHKISARKFSDTQVSLEEETIMS